MKPEKGSNAMLATYFVIALALSVIVAIMFPSVSAETVTGTLDSSPVGTYLNYDPTYSGYGYDLPPNMSQMRAYNIQASGGLESLVLSPKSPPGWTGALNFGTNHGTAIGSTPSASTTFEAYVGTTHVGSGTLGFQRIFDSLGNQVGGSYAYYLFSSWDPGTLSNNQSVPYLVNFTYDEDAVFHVFPAGDYGADYAEASRFTLCHGAGMTYILRLTYPFHNSYSVTKPGGIGISGSVIKDTYASKVYVVNDTTRSVIANEGGWGISEYNFTIPNTNPLGLAVLDVNGNWYNATIPFAQDAVPTYTPTPTPTPGGPQGGAIRSMAQCVNGQTGAAIHGCNLHLRNVEANVWSNSTNDADGTHYIDTAPGNHIDAYGDATGYTATSRLNLISSGTIMYELIMQPGSVPAAESGNVRLYVNVNDRLDSYPIAGAIVQVDAGPNPAAVWTTNAVGVASGQIANSTDIWITASAEGFDTATIHGVTSAFGPDTFRIELNQQLYTVTPTTEPGAQPTDPISGLPVVTPTLPPDQQDAAMMQQLREAGPSLIGLGIIAIIFGLLKMLMKW